jgi:hypothetical protein
LLGEVAVLGHVELRINHMDGVWLFNGDGGGSFPAAVFTTRAAAEEWIAGHRLTGCLTKYPLDIGVYEWAIERGAFKLKHEYQTEPKFIGRFSSASMEHDHYEDGLCVTDDPES